MGAWCCCRKAEKKEHGSDDDSEVHVVATAYAPAIGKYFVSRSPKRGDKNSDDEEASVFSDASSVEVIDPSTLFVPLISGERGDGNGHRVEGDERCVTEGYLCHPSLMICQRHRVEGVERCVTVGGLGRSAPTN